MPDNEDWPNNHHVFCDCDECKVMWEKLEDNEEIPIGVDDELEYELRDLCESERGI